MFTVKINADGSTKCIDAAPDSLLSELLKDNGIYIEHPCGGTGKCGKCLVYINGRNELSCRYRVTSDITVTVPEQKAILSPSADISADPTGGEYFIAIDIGTTTVAGALCPYGSGTAVCSLTVNNPQRAYGADVMSRIAYCTANGPDEMHSAIISCINGIIGKLTEEFPEAAVSGLYLAGNTTMLHLLTNTDCSSMGVSPYTPVFLEAKSFRSPKIGICGNYCTHTVPCISSFVGADITSGINYVSLPAGEGYDLLIDLGTNAEIVLFSKDRILCTSAAAGPCFEGANISCGMSAVNGAMCSYRADGTFSVIGGTDPDGICATGLIDLISVLLDKEIIDETGKMNCTDFEITESVRLSQEDVRQYQLAKSAVFSAIQVLISRAGINFEIIEHMYVAGGFSSAMNIENAVRSGLFPGELKDVFVPVNNSSLLGTIKYAASDKKIPFSPEAAEYVNLSSDPEFADAFIENMLF